jgi:hypothetical protein
MNPELSLILLSPCMLGTDESQHEALLVIHYFKKKSDDRVTSSHLHGHEYQKDIQWKQLNPTNHYHTQIYYPLCLAYQMTSGIFFHSSHSHAL